jgi:hypothetical protein
MARPRRCPGCDVGNFLPMIIHPTSAAGAPVIADSEGRIASEYCELICFIYVDKTPFII